MGFQANKVQTPSGEIPEGFSVSNDNGVNLSKQEIEVLLNLIKNSNFKGEVLELLYILVIKLQKQYKNLP
jgi:hypothetical protein